MCPTGWHLPSDGEWCTLATFLDSTVDCSVIGWSGTDAGGRMKSMSGLWFSPNTGATNSSRFSVLPSGWSETNYTFIYLRNDACFWSASNFSNSDAINRGLAYYSSSIYRRNHGKTSFFSIRCLKD
jgi:uncharacterized protein (TIGR02145 family)